MPYDEWFNRNCEKSENVMKKRKKEGEKKILFNKLQNTDGRDEEINHDNKYKQIHEINLSKKNIINFKNKKNVSFEKLQDLYILNLSENIISEANDIKYLENLMKIKKIN